MAVLVKDPQQVRKERPEAAVTITHSDGAVETYRGAVDEVTLKGTLQRETVTNAPSVAIGAKERAYLTVTIELTDGEGA